MQIGKYCRLDHSANDSLPRLKATKLFKPYAFEDLLGLVKSILPVPARIRAEIAPAQNWQSQPSPAFADLIYGEHPMANEGACA